MSVLDDWEASSACLGSPPAWWFPRLADPDDLDQDDGTLPPEPEQPGDNHGAKAKAICSTCVVAEACIVAAIQRGEEHGIWGGAGGKQMRILRRAYRAGGPVWDLAWAHHLGVLRGTITEIQDANGPGATHGIRATAAKSCTCLRCRFGTSVHLRGPEVARLLPLPQKARTA